MQLCRITLHACGLELRRLGTTAASGTTQLPVARVAGHRLVRAPLVLVCDCIWLVLPLTALIIDGDNGLTGLRVLIVSVCHHTGLRRFCTAMLVR